MSALVIPAPLWRRVSAAIYDGLLLLGLWMVAALFEVMIRDQLLGLAMNFYWLQAYYFLIGLAFFCGFWVRGGQTLGMRAWRLQVRGVDGSGLVWAQAVLRYSLMLAGWATVLTPPMLQLPRLAQLDYADSASVVSLVLVAAGVAFALLDPRRRCPWDWISRTEVVQLPKAG